MTSTETSVETNGELVVIDTTVAPNGFVAAEHIHPERFEILKGEVEFKLDREIVVARASDVVIRARGCTPVPEPR